MEGNPFYDIADCLLYCGGHKATFIEAIEVLNLKRTFYTDWSQGTSTKYGVKVNLDILHNVFSYDPI